MEGDEGRWKGQEEAVEGNGGRQENSRVGAGDGRGGGWRGEGTGAVWFTQCSCSGLASSVRGTTHC